MQITKEWLENEAILTNENGSLLLSQKQTELLYKWFPDLFKTDGLRKNLVKHWNKRLCEKEIDSNQKTHFKKAKMKENEIPSLVSKKIKEEIEKGFASYRKEYKSDPMRPQLKFVSMIGHTHKVRLLEVSFSGAPHHNTVVRFSLNVKGNNRHLQATCSGDEYILINEKKNPTTVLYEETERSGENYKLEKIKDCTGLDIVEVLDSFQTIDFFKEEPQKELNIDDIQKIFMRDFDKVTEMRSKKNLKPLSLIEFGQLANVDFNKPDSIQNYMKIKKLDVFLK